MSGLQPSEFSLADMNVYTHGVRKYGIQNKMKPRVQIQSVFVG